MLIYVTILIIFNAISKQARGRQTWSLRATWCPRALCWWPLLYRQCGVARFLNRKALIL